MTTERHTWIAFLRAINLGANRKFPKQAIIAAVVRAGGTDVETYINTGNVRFDHPVGDRAEMEAILEEAFAADRFFEVPTICLTPAELKVIANDAAAVGMGHEGRQFVFLCKEHGDTGSREALVARAGEGEQVYVIGRAVHLLTESFHQTKITNAVVERHIAVSTNRNLNVIRTLADRWA
ncbi:DUF1697 domain-containing protein [Nocardioides albus]|uniref:Uncharacterized protein (DUF1697 family) n=1 Tax=Nocardioides albus TaxID=1841 RepID=A0A7W5F9K9_9ACTN|nr:DUF1697 domain-containing protein [Nocardioides albus]MBB3090308.1 uncharacterized protein (DUF1697 family) [Nocardioides albus]GGU29204.1 hypothetical protein GCM10007979_30190 [Nocardioides albus]